MHGLSGFKEQPHIQVMADSFKENGFTVVRFDTTNSCGESYGSYEDGTVTNYYEDLIDVINWARDKDWHQEPFCLAGHSLGGIAISLYAQKYPKEVKALAPISTVISGKLSAETKQNKEQWEEWQRTGWKVWESSSKPGTIKRLKWNHMVDKMQYDLLDNADKLTMPVLLVVGSEDEATPPEHQEVLYKKLPGEKEMHIIKGAQHSFRGKETALDELKQILSNWITKHCV